MGILGIIYKFLQGTPAILFTAVTDVRRFKSPLTDFLNEIRAMFVAFIAYAALVKTGTGTILSEYYNASEPPL